MRKKHVFFAVSLAATLTVAALSMFNFEKLGNFRTKANGGDYSISITNVADFVSGGGVARTSAGAEITFNVDGFVGNVLQSGSTFYNTTAITGITEIELVTDNYVSVFGAVKNSTNGQLITRDSAEANGYGTVVASFGYEPDYFYVDNGGTTDDVTITSIHIVFVCKDPKTFDVTINLSFTDTYPSSNVYLVFDFNHERVPNDDWINGKPNVQDQEIYWDNSVGAYSKTFTNCRFGELRFEFREYDLYISGYDNWKPERYFITKNIVLDCYATSFPATNTETTVFTCSEQHATGRKIDIYSVNDFHGHVEYVENQEIGIERMGTYFKEKGEDENTLLLDIGDTWQEGFYSSYNEGAMVTDIYNYVGFDARIVGNHDFDWGTSAIEANSAATYPRNNPNGYQTPVLGANIYKYDFENREFLKDGNDEMIHYDEVCQSTITQTMGNGLKVGVVGVIGSDQITSISTPLTHNFGFYDHIQTIKDEATRLRSEGCDIVICGIHADEDAVKNQGLENYVDVVLCAHSHQREYHNYNGLWYLQFGKNGEHCGHITIAEDLSDGGFVVDYMEMTPWQMNSEISELDTTISSIYNQYMDEATPAGNEILHMNSVQNGGGMDYNIRSNVELPNLAAKAMYEEAAKQYTDHPILFSTTNVARETLVAPLTYAEVYSTFPFRNEVYVCKTTGQEILNELQYVNFYYFNPSLNYVNLDVNEWYYICIQDFLLFHVNGSREYNFWPIAVEHIEKKLTVDMQTIIFDYFRDNGYKDGSETLYLGDLQNTSLRHDDKFIRIPTTFVVDRDGDIEETVVFVGLHEPYSNYYPADPTWEGHTFLGWTFSNGNTLDGVTCSRSYRVYAKFEEGVDDRITTGMLDYDDFGQFLTPGAYQFAAGDQTVTITASGTFTNNTTYKEIGFNGVGSSLLISAPSDYHITQIKMYTFNTYDNINFYAGTAAVGDPLEEDITTFGGNSYHYGYTDRDVNALGYVVNTTSSNVLLNHTYSGSTYILYLAVYIEQNA